VKDLPPLTEWGLREGHLSLRQNLRGIYLGLYSAELVTRLIEEHDPHADLFDRLERTIPELATPRREQAFLAFQLDLLRESGYLPELFACVSCGAALEGATPIYFSAERGGLICRNCEQATPDRAQIDGRLVRLLQGILRLPRANGTPQRLPQLTRHQTDPINRMFANQIQHTLGRGLRLPRYVLG
jgi:DNA repair protein RecO (recombination protein O)